MAKTKALISFAVTAKLICVFVFAYAKSWFSHDEAQIIARVHFTVNIASLENSKTLDNEVTVHVSVAEFI